MGSRKPETPSRSGATGPGSHAMVFTHSAATPDAADQPHTPSHPDATGPGPHTTESTHPAATPDAADQPHTPSHPDATGPGPRTAGFAHSAAAPEVAEQSAITLDPAAATRSVAPLPDDALVLGLDVGGTTIKGEITDAGGRALAVSAAATPHGVAAFDAMVELGERLLTELPESDRRRVARAAVVLPGIVDTARSIAVFSSNVGWRDVHVGDRFTGRWRIPTLIEHDVAVAGWAEGRYGAGRGHENVCVVILGTGISGTLSVGGRLVRSNYGQVGEYGHVPVRRDDGLPCPCGNIGCVETVAGGAAIARAYTRRTGREIDGAADVFALMATDPDAAAVVQDAVDALADGLVGIVHAACPELIVLGGGLAGAGAALTEPLHRALDDRLRLVPTPHVVLGEFGARAGLAGAALLARHGALA
ncbi:ROK family protein [Nocardia sp. NBC_00508]|uniref:ROK family protein n=1 Tax=Nocardia sp. NBC_00508 TaxID=2975992 RepID=UPI002E8077AC|nr:ROK family protein [Nocardia sp. NBC_00508]WUD68979.1 ROK family protein [Nocardia sp. NBC_00508]